MYILPPEKNRDRLSGARSYFLEYFYEYADPEKNRDRLRWVFKNQRNYGYRIIREIL